MGRLFWKIFGGFWLTLLITVLGVAAALTIREEALRRDEALAAGPRSDYVVRTFALMARHGGEAALRSLYAEWPTERGTPPLVVDPSGRDLFGRTVPGEALHEAGERLARDPQARNVRQVTGQTGQTYTIFLPSNPSLAPKEPLLPPLRLEAPIALALAALLASLGVSAWLARHFSRPIRKLQDAFLAASHGQLEVRVSRDMGSRRDEIGELGREFDGMAKQLQQLVGSQNRLLHDVSHELRSPLARLQVAVGLARQNPAQVDRALSRIEHEAERLDALVGEILTLARLEARNVAHADDYVDLVELLASIVDDACFEAEGSDRRVVFTSAVQGELVLRARGELLHRAIENVVRNALRHSPLQSVVEVHLSQEAARRRVHITVADSGPGIPESDLEAIFEPFFRSETAGSGGYGLGLAITRRAIEAHGGSVCARNRSSGGLEVRIELPTPEPATPPHPASATPSGA